MLGMADANGNAGGISSDMFTVVGKRRLIEC